MFPLPLLQPGVSMAPAVDAEIRYIFRFSPIIQSLDLVPGNRFSNLSHDRNSGYYAGTSEVRIRLIKGA